MKLLTLARDLRRRKSRERQGLFVCEGIRAAEELLRSSVPIVGALLGPHAGNTPRGADLIASVAARKLPTEQVGEAEFQSAADTEAPQGVLLVGKVPERSLDAVRGRESLRLLILDAIQDPGNVGTILRTAAAFGVDATIALPGTVDLWNAKVVRSAMGALFDHPALSATWDELDAFRRTDPFAIWAADAAGEAIAGLPVPSRVALVVGNEGQGLEEASRARADRLVALPIRSTVESLNVAVATGIFLYLLRP